LPIIPKLQRLFSNERDAKLVRWHVECRKKDGMLRHHVDSHEWRNINREWPDFSDEIRNLRLGLCMDEMNPYSQMSSRHSTWPILLCVYNLTPWLCMKIKYMMMPLLNSGPKQSGNDIDIFLTPLVQDLNKLWRDVVRIYDAYKKEHFIIRAMVFCTINNFLAFGNMSGLKTKGAKTCPICEDNTHSIRLKNCKKNV
jgi:predicted YcjX-like family ATPase